MKTCKTCKHWQKPLQFDGSPADDICNPVDPDTLEAMERGFETRLCKLPDQTFCEAPVRSDGFALADGSGYYAVLTTGEDFGCVRHEEETTDGGTKC